MKQEGNACKSITDRTLPRDLLPPWGGGYVRCVVGDLRGGGGVICNLKARSNQIIIAIDLLQTDFYLASD